jgi:exodeoxyribonuclease V gamma subunit
LDPVVDLAALIRFFCNPAAAFLRERLGVRLIDPQGPLANLEPFVIERFAQEEVRERCLAVLRRGAEPREAEAVTRAEGGLPHGAVGAALFAQNAAWCARFAPHLAVLEAGGALPDRDVDLVVGEQRIVGTLTDLYSGGLRAYRPGKERGGDRVAWWIRHLALNAVAPDGMALQSSFLAEDAQGGWILRTLNPVADPLSVLATLLELYQEGKTRPVPFFPRAGFAYASTLKKTGDQEKARDAAAKVFAPPYANALAYSESRNPYVRLAFRGRGPLDALFERVTQIFFAPFLDACTE